MKKKKVPAVKHVTKGSVLDDLRFSSEEAENLKMRAVLMRAVESYINEHNLTQAESAKLFGVTQPRVSDLIRGKINLFTVDMLINMLARAGVSVHLVIDDRMAA